MGYTGNILLYRTDPDVQLWLNQLTIQPSNTYISNLTTLVVQLKAANIWGQLDRFWIFATEQQQHARVSLVNPSSTQITEVNTPTWTKQRGYTGDGISMYLNTNYVPSASTINSKTNVSLGVYTRTNPSVASAVEIGGNNGGAGGSALNVALNFTAIGKLVEIFDVNVAGSANSDVSLVSGYRSNSTQNSLYVRGALIQTNTSNVSAGNRTGVPLFVLAYNNNTTATDFSTAQLSMAYAGTSVINQQYLYNAFQTFATAEGFNV